MRPSERITQLEVELRKEEIKQDKQFDPVLVLALAIRNYLDEQHDQNRGG